MIALSRTIIPLALCALVSLISAPSSGGSLASNEKISIHQTPGVQHLIASLQLMVNKEAREEQNHFFIAKYPATVDSTYMLWREGNVLWILSPKNTEAAYWHQAILFPGKSKIDLDKDVVPTDEAVGTSTYLVSQPWVNSITHDAVLNGDLIIIEKGDPSGYMTSIRQHPGFQNLIATLQSMVNEEAKEKKNHFFIAKYPATREHASMLKCCRSFASSAEYTYMLWREGNALWTLGLGNPSMEHWYMTVRDPQSTTMINLEKATVSIDEAVSSNAYIENPPQIDAIIYDTAMHGDLIVINKTEKLLR